MDPSCGGRVYGRGVQPGAGGSTMSTWRLLTNAGADWHGVVAAFGAK